MSSAFNTYQALCWAPDKDQLQSTEPRLTAESRTPSVPLATQGTGEAAQRLGRGPQPRLLEAARGHSGTFTSQTLLKCCSIRSQTGPILPFPEREHSGSFSSLRIAYLVLLLDLQFTLTF